MYVIEVIPLVTLPPQVPQLLSYFFDRELPAGSLVEATMNKRKMQAVVVASVPLTEVKATLKKALFQLQKLSGVIDERPVISQIQLKIAAWLARRYYASLGACLKTVLPPFFGVKKYPLKPAGTFAPNIQEPEKPLIVTVSAANTASTVENLAKKTVKAGGQVLFIVPEKTNVGYFSAKLKDALPVLSLHSDTGNSAYYSIWRAVADGTPQLVIGTRIALFLPFSNLRAVIVEDPSNQAYKSDMSPRYYTPDLARKVARLNSARYISLSAVPTLREYANIKSGDYEIANRLPAKKTSVEIVNMVQEMQGGNFSLFSNKMRSHILNTLHSKEPILLYSARRAYSGVLVCKNCGLVAKCANCDIPLRMYKAPAPADSQRAEWLLVCYHCSAYRSLPERCGNCNGYQLTSGGVAGSQKIAEEVQKLLQRNAVQGAEIFVLDSDMIRDDKREKELLAKIDGAKCPIVVATRKILSQRYTRVFGFVGVPNADALMSARDFRTEEYFVENFSKLFDFEPKNMVVQTYTPENHALKAGVSGNVAEFYDRELAARKLLSFPPFTYLVKLTYAHKSEERASQTARILSEKLKMVTAQLELSDTIKILGPSPASVAKENNIYRYSVILKIAPAIGRIDTILRYVPSDWIIDFDPKSIV